MKYKIGDKVKYDSGEWVFFGTVSAVIENSICPCYRLNVERMEKSNCKISITQFEFELESIHEGERVDTLEDDNQKIEYFKKQYAAQSNENLSDAITPPPSMEEETPFPPNKKTDTTWDRHFAAYLQGDKSNLISTWAYQNRKQYQKGTLPKDRVEKLMGINFSFDSIRNKKPPKGIEKKAPEEIITEKIIPPVKKKKTSPSNKKTDKTWEKHFVAYLQGDKSNLISTWAYQNRKQYQKGTLPKDRVEKLMGINFSFDSIRNMKSPKSTEKNSTEKIADEKTNIWEKQFRQWKNGDRRNSLQRWLENNVKRFTAGKLSEEKIQKLKEVGILM